MDGGGLEGWRRWRAGHSERWRHIRTLPGPWTLLWPSPKSRAQAPPTRLHPQASLPAHLIQHVQPAEKKSGQKSLTPLPRCNPIVSRLPLPLIPPGPLEDTDTDTIV